MDIGQPEIPALMPTNQTFVVKSQKAKHRRLQIVDMHGVLDDLSTKVAGLAVDDSRLDPTSGHPDREAVGMVIPAKVG